MASAKSKRRPRRPQSQSTSTVIGILLIAISAILFSWHSHLSDNAIPTLLPDRTDWSARRQEVREAFDLSWNAYTKGAWGKDKFHPISQTGSQMSPNGLGWMIVNSLDTLMIMNHTEGLAQARLWIQRSLDYNQDQDVNTFETTIRMLGGLLSAHFLSSHLPGVSSRRDYVYLERAIDLADRLLGACDSPSGIPWASIILSSGKGVQSHVDGGASSTAEATSLQLEMKYIAELTGKETYWHKAEHVMQVVDNNRAPAGLVPIFH